MGDYQEFLLNLTKKCSDFFKQMHDHCDQFSKQLASQKTKKKEPTNHIKKAPAPPSPPEIQKPKKKKVQRLGPKRPPTAYQLYFAEQQGILHKKFPDLALTDITSMIGKEWQNLSQDDKVLYQKVIISSGVMAVYLIGRVVDWMMVSEVGYRVSDDKQKTWLKEMIQFKKDNPDLDIKLPGESSKKKSKIAEKSPTKTGSERPEKMSEFLSKKNVLDSEEEEDENTGNHQTGREVSNDDSDSDNGIVQKRMKL